MTLNKIPICLICVYFAIINAIGQTRIMTKAEWDEVMVGDVGAPFFCTKPVPPYRLTVNQSSFDDGDVILGFSEQLVFEFVTQRDYRVLKKQRVGDKTITEESVFIEEQRFGRRNESPWVAGQGLTQPKVVRPDPALSPFERKPGYGESVYFSLGIQLYKGQLLSVYENVTRHALVRKSDQTEVYYEDRYKTWLAPGKVVIRSDRTNVIIQNDKTFRAVSSYEWERNAKIEPLEKPESALRVRNDRK